MTVRFHAREFETARDAIQYADAAGGAALRLGGGFYVVAEREAIRLEGAGVELAYLCEWELPDGRHRIVTIPVG